jgi:serine/threonine protein kinase
MARRPESCDQGRLDLFLHNRLPDQHREDVEAHLSVCPACRNKLDELAGGGRWWSEVRQYLGDDGASVMDSSGRATRPRLTGVDLDFLQPSDNSASLGRLGSYEVLEVVGCGGMGIVLKAFDPALHRPVAIKVLAAEYAANGTARKRFAREARAAAAVIHDHVVPVHAVDADTTPPYLVMAFIAGRSLQQRIDQTGPLELKEILRIGVQTASGLAAAHAQGLVHRDIKPANIMLENGIERVRITDFGLARAVDDVSVTQHGAVAGTPQFMAPEQAQGYSVDQRADLFSLGSTMYAMCTGRPPFRSESAVAVLRQVCDTEPAPIRSINPDIPVWLEGIICKLHAKEPAERFQSAEDVAVLLEQCLAHVQQPDHHPLPDLAIDLGRRVPCPKSAPSRGRATQVAVGTVAVIASAVIGFALVWRFGNGAAVESKAGLSLEPAVNAPAEALVIPPDDEFASKLEGVRTRLEELDQSLSQSLPCEESDKDLRALQMDLQTLSRELTGEAEPGRDLIEERIHEIRERLGRVKNSLNSGSN